MGNCGMLRGVKAEAARCLYCGKRGVWWECECVWSREVREGRRVGPVIRRLSGGRTVIELDEETVGRYRPVGSPVGFVGSVGSVECSSVDAVDPTETLQRTAELTDVGSPDANEGSLAPSVGSAVDAEE